MMLIKDDIRRRTAELPRLAVVQLYTTDYQQNYTALLSKIFSSHHQTTEVKSDRQTMASDGEAFRSVSVTINKCIAV